MDGDCVEDLVERGAEGRLGGKGGVITGGSTPIQVNTFSFTPVETKSEWDTQDAMELQGVSQHSCQ